MKKILILLAFTGIFLLSAIAMAHTPNQVCGFQLGADILAYKDRVDMESALPVRYASYIKEVEIKETEYLKSGLIAYGTCAAPGKIVRIKLKYSESGKAFFDALLKQFEKRFGKANEWRGDPFHIVIAWKWSFVDKENNNISLILQHNKLDEEEKMGNSVKLTMTSAIEKEHQRCKKTKPDSDKPKKTIQTKDWDFLVPR